MPNERPLTAQMAPVQLSFFSGQRNRVRAVAAMLTLSPVVFHLTRPGQVPPVAHVVGPAVVRQYDEGYYRLRLDSLRAAFGYRKHFPPAFELPALLALSHYPELRNERIRFQTVPKAMPLVASRPDPGNLFRGRPEWVYNIFISEEAPETLRHDLLKKFSFNAQVGILGHELAHTRHYQDKSAWQMLVTGVRYLLSDAYRARFELDTDRDAIAHGLGWQVHAYALHYRRNPRLSRPEIAAIDRYYLPPAAVLAHMRQLSAKKL
ncbi:MAG: hypothetical protein H7Z75_10985 [Ferruginibacter sp.]|nr:hypothetical protein [Cytophagales bacterium]